MRVYNAALGPKHNGSAKVLTPKSTIAPAKFNIPHCHCEEQSDVAISVSSPSTGED
jgi:hypothetical protein